MKIYKKCKFCKNKDELDVLGIEGVWEKAWTFCPEHKKDAYDARDEFLESKGHKSFANTPTHEKYYQTHCSQS